MRVLIIDAANVVGSRPDGWWRDRPAAARRLYDRLSGAGELADQIVLVLEGEARRGHGAGEEGLVRTVHAGGSGDDTIVNEAIRHVAVSDGREVIVVTADRALRERVEATGADTRGPGWLLDRL